jgi:hypothetical protein
MLYPFPLGHPMDTYSMVDTAPTAASAAAAFPAAIKAAAVRVLLRPGDVLWCEPRHSNIRAVPPQRDVPLLTRPCSSNRGWQAAQVLVAPCLPTDSRQPQPLGQRVAVRDRREASKARGALDTWSLPATRDRGFLGGTRWGGCSR